MQYCQAIVRLWPTRDEVTVTPNTCLRCQIPLATTSPSGLCATCQGINDDTVSAPTQPRGQFGLTRSADNGDRTTATAVLGGTSPSLRRILLNPPAGYTLLEELGHGGMGYVYKARETDTERIVAIKFLRDRLNAAANGRFRTEVQALAKVRHPNVVPILSVNLSHDDPYFTMEYESNGSLATTIKEKKRLVPAEAARMVEQLARGLAAIHAADVLHRDLKPHNVLLAEDGTAKLADLGLAKRIDKVDEQTHAGALVGTLNYMAPEQAGRNKRAIDVRTDVYGLGAVLYQCLTGKPPFPGNDPNVILKRVLTESPRPARINSEDRGLALFS